MRTTSQLVLIALFLSLCGCGGLIPGWGSGSSTASPTGPTAGPTPSDTLECDFLAPDHGSTEGDEPINVKGAGMLLVTEVEIDGMPVDDWRVSNDRNLHLRSLPHDEGIVDVTLRTADGQECSLPYEYVVELDDADGDGVPDDEDNCPDDANPGQEDADDDGAGDACDDCPLDPDDDIDADGICGDVDNCPDDANPMQEDGDADGLGDACDDCPADPDNDVDGDGVCGDVDNCPDVANPGQEDADGNGIGDACEGGGGGGSDTLECTHLSPDHGPTDGDHPMNAHGMGMLLVTEVEVDGIPVTDFTTDSDNVLHWRSPAHDAGTVDVVLRTADGQECTLSYTYEER